MWDRAAPEKVPSKKIQDIRKVFQVMFTSFTNAKQKLEKEGHPPRKPNIQNHTKPTKRDKYLF